MSEQVIHDEQLFKVIQILGRALDARRNSYDRVALLALDEIIEMEDEQLRRQKEGAA